MIVIHANLLSLPDLIHDSIARFLHEKDLFRLMESSRRLLEVYSSQVKEMTIDTSQVGVLTMYLVRENVIPESYFT